MELKTRTLQHVTDRWDDEEAGALGPLERLVYRSNLLGQNWRITNTGGGNTSAKLMEEDPLTGEEVEVLWVKGSGGDLRTAEPKNFASLYQKKLLALQDVYASFDERGPKTDAEDQMVKMYPHCTFNLNPRAPSIDTPLHAFIPHKHIDHTHPVACIAIATAEKGEALTREIYGDEVVWIDWQRPGFELGLTMQRVCEAHPEAKGIMMGGHGLINWAADDKECYHLTLRLIDQAEAYLQQNGKAGYAFGGQRYAPLPETERKRVLVEVLPWLRGRVSQERRMIGTVQTDEEILRFTSSEDAERLAGLGTSCPDHFLRTRIKPLYVDWCPQANDVDGLKTRLEAGLAQYRKDYAAYYEEHKRSDSPAMRGAEPTVVLIPGIGMIAWGKSKSESRVTAEFYNAAVQVMKGAEAVGTYTALDRQEAFDIEYWQLEEEKLKRMPPEEELARQVVVVVGAGSGIGREVVSRLIPENATMAALDLDAESAEGAAEDILSEIGMGIGVAGTGISGSGDAIGLGCDITDRASVRAALQQVVLAYGGIDHVVITAGLYASPDEDGHIADEQWDASFAVNVKGVYVVADEVAGVWAAQGLGACSMVVTTSANAVVAKDGSFAYDTSKAAANHLIRELAVALAPQARVNGVAPATVVEGSSMFPRERVMASLEKYELDHDESDATEALKDRLAQFYAGRTLTKTPIEPEDQAEAVFLLLSSKLSKTTGQILAVDGGLKEAFLR